MILGRTGPGRYGPRRLLGATAPQFVAWSTGTVLGVVVGARIADPERFGLDALFPAFFCVLLAGELAVPETRRVALVAGLVALALVPLTPPGIPVVAATLAVGVGRLRR